MAAKQSVYIVEVIQNVVKDVSAKLGRAVYYQYGGFKEVFENLIQLTNAQSPKTYPLVWLVTDIKEDSGKELDVYSEANLNILIFNVTKPDYKAPERTEKSFKSILNPIYEQLIDSIKYSNEIKTEMNGLSKHTHFKHYSWGRDKIEMEKNGVKFSDFIDCIEIQNISLKFKNKNNCK